MSMTKVKKKNSESIQFESGHITTFYIIYITYNWSHSYVYTHTNTRHYVWQKIHFSIPFKIL